MKDKVAATATGLGAGGYPGRCSGERGRQRGRGRECSWRYWALRAGEASAAVGKLDSALPVETLVREALKLLARRN